MFESIRTWLRIAAARREPSPPAVRLRVEGLEARKVPANLLWDSAAVAPTVGTASALTASLYQPVGFLTTVTGSTKVLTHTVALAGYTNPCF